MLTSVLVGDELGQVKLIKFNANFHKDSKTKQTQDDFTETYVNDDSNSPIKSNDKFLYSTQPKSHPLIEHKIVKLNDECFEQEPAATRAILSIRPIQKIKETSIDTTDKPNNLFLIANKVGQVFVCNSDAAILQHEKITSRNIRRKESDLPSLMTPVYYNLYGKVAIIGAQPVNQTNILVIYKNGNVQHVDISQNVLQSMLRFKRKAIKVLGLSCNSDAKATNWRIDGSKGTVSRDFRSNRQDDADFLTSFATGQTADNCLRKDKFTYNESPCKTSHRCNRTDRLVPARVISMITSHDNYKSSIRVSKWNSITSLNLIYRKLALYDLVSVNDVNFKQKPPNYVSSCFKMNDNRLAVGGHGYTVRVYDVGTQKAIYNCRFGTKRNPLVCSRSGDPDSVADLEWLGGNKTTQTTPTMIATCNGLDATVKVYDTRGSSKPVFNIDLTHETEASWQPYVGHPRGCQFISLSTSGAPYSTAIPSQQLAVGSKNGQLYLVDLRFPSKSYRSIGRLNGFCGGEVRQIRFVSESFDTTRMISCAADRFVRVHRFHTSFTSVISQKLTSRIFVGTKPICIQPVCAEQSYNSSCEYE